VAGGSGGAFQILDGRGVSQINLSGLRVSLFVGDDLAQKVDAMLESGDLLGPGAAGVIGIGDAGGVLAFGFGQVV
jgi:hypothetical protein